MLVEGNKSKGTMRKEIETDSERRGVLNTVTEENVINLFPMKHVHCIRLSKYK